MAKAGYCSLCGRNVWVSSDGRCQNGHDPSCVSRLYDVAIPTPPPLDAAAATPPQAFNAPPPAGNAWSQPPYGQPYGGPPVELPPTDLDKKATRSMVLGFIGVAAWCLPIIGIPVTAFGLAWGISGLKSTRRGYAIAGIILCSFFLALAVINAIGGAWMAVHGQNTFVNQLLHQPTR